ncbi:MAG: nucleotidyltransferase domain-containing protein, partial [Gammaproteobacteria bacterium]|nr:nucleotidyltransferase domain-containing protein [Gammaproteobacteria bacterium]
MRNLDEIRELVKEIKESLVALHGDAIKKTIVYGSFARGDATEDSDIDMAIVVADRLDPRQVEEELDDLLFSILLERKELVSVLAIPESIFENYRS